MDFSNRDEGLEHLSEELLGVAVEGAGVFLRAGRVALRERISVSEPRTRLVV